MNHPLKRRDFLKLTALSAVGLAPTGRAAPEEMLVYIGTYTDGKGVGIHVCRMNLSTGALTQTSLARLKSSPSFLAIDPHRRFLYAVNEVGEFNGRKNGGVTAFAIHQKTGALTQLNQQSAPGVPCYVSVHPSGRFVLIANYRGGNVAIYPVDADGSLRAASDVAQHTGKGADPGRQDGSRAHCIVVDAAGRHAFAADLGLDKVMSYKLDTATGKFVPNGFAQARPGSGPRHLDLHPGGRFAYVINELNSTVTAYTHDQNRGMLAEIQTLATLPAAFGGTNRCADVHVHPSGRFLYGSNRGHDSLVVYAIDGATGRLTLVGHESAQGKSPRNFAIDPTGRFLLAANQYSDNVVVFHLDPRNGKLQPAQQQIAVGAPACVKLIPAFSPA